MGHTTSADLNEPMRHLVIIENGANSYGAYLPDLPGGVTVGKTKREVHNLGNNRESLSHVDLYGNSVTLTIRSFDRWLFAP